MNPVTEYRKGLQIGLPPGEKLVTYHEYVRAAAGEKMSVEETERFARHVYQIVLVLVLDNGFSIEAKRSFPSVRNDFTLRNMSVWVAEMKNWFENLSRGERKLFRTAKFAA